MTPIVSELVASMPDWPVRMHCAGRSHLGADFGGNLTVAGASANVVMVGIARRANNPISFWESRSGPTSMRTVTLNRTLTGPRLNVRCTRNAD